MSASASPKTMVPQKFSVRQDQILDAAQTCFIRNGYYRSTMQDIAREAAMSSPNIYRYFVSKEAVLISMADRERQRSTDRIAQFEEIGDKRSALMRIIAYYHLEISREAAILRLELWSESTRNTQVGAIIRERENKGRAWFIDALASLEKSPDCDPLVLFEAISALLKGIIVSRAVLDDFDAAPAIAQLYALLDAGLAGRIPTIPRPDHIAVG
ncbi:TetR/AcrR family transcriptional regulator [Methylobacterium sp. BTF04]|uniref:TetR/AcrR family transcriptional regulator n=1 Tax=Methylobacterium sp. BTF04 TaxID=2708300 RepID=UPI0013D29BB2|nr:TetR/AcrR family transcriptional regulator [Methylobacterium sp. BTF04]NEU12868.1 TetR/AcrR family transcriptional regulator [Methylobacterium sp. BTF04]